MTYTFNQVKEEARAKGYNLSASPFAVSDFPIINQYLLRKGIHTNLSALQRDISAGAYSALDTQALFKTKDVLQGQQYVHVELRAGLRLESSETITVEPPMELCKEDGTFELVSELNVDYDKQVTKLIFRYQQLGGTKSFVLKSPSFESAYVDGEAQPPNKRDSICGTFICGTSTASYTLD